MRILNGQQQDGLIQLKMHVCVCVCVCVCTRLCVFTNNTTPFALNLLSQISFTDI